MLQKDQSKGNVASNYRPIISLPLMWKLLTGVIADQIDAHLDHEKLLPSSRSNDLLYIDRTVIKEVNSRNKNLAMAWIDYQKDYDIKSLLVNSMEKWKVILCSGSF